VFRRTFLTQETTYFILFVLVISNFFMFQIKLVSFDAQAIPERHPGRRDGVGQDHPGNLLLGSPQGDGGRGPASHHRSVVHHG